MYSARECPHVSHDPVDGLRLEEGAGEEKLCQRARVCQCVCAYLSVYMCAYIYVCMMNESRKRGGTEENSGMEKKHAVLFLSKRGDIGSSFTFVHVLFRPGPPNMPTNEEEEEDVEEEEDGFSAFFLGDKGTAVKDEEEGGRGASDAVSLGGRGEWREDVEERKGEARGRGGLDRVAELGEVEEAVGVGVGEGLLGPRCGFGLFLLSFRVILMISASVSGGM